METRIDEIAPNIFRLSTFVAQVAAPAGFTFNQFLLLGDEPLLFHTGQRMLFPSVRAAVERLMPVERLRWIGFGHFEADECGALNDWLAAASAAQAAHGLLGCDVSLNDFAARAPRPLADGEALDLGGLTVRHIDTPHVPHGWDAGLLYEEVYGAFAGRPGITWHANVDAGAKYRLNDRGGDYYGILRSTNGVTAAINEALFLSASPSEADLLARPDVQADEAAAITRAVRRYLTSGDPGSGFVQPIERRTPAGGGGGAAGCVDPPLTR